MAAGTLYPIPDYLVSYGPLLNYIDWYNGRHPQQKIAKESEEKEQEQAAEDEQKIDQAVSPKYIFSGYFIL